MAPPSTETDAALPAWPPSDKPLNTVLLPGSKARLFVGARTSIKAPAAFVFERLTRAKGYRDWCTFIPSMKVISRPGPSSAPSEDPDALTVGAVVELKAVMNMQRPEKRDVVQVRVTDWSTPAQPSSYVPRDLLENDGSWSSDLSKTYRVAWSTAGLLSWFISAERFSECIVVKDDECEFRTWELQGGLVAIIVKLLYGKALDDAFDSFARDLKAICEKEYSRS